MRHTLRAEWTKLRTVRSTGWLLGAAVGLTVLVSLGSTAALNTDFCASPAGCDEDTTRASLAGVYLGQAAVVVLAVLAIASEYGTRMIQTTLQAEPRRLRVLLAKTAVVLSVVLPAAVLGVAGSLLVGRWMLPRNGFTPANGYPPLSLADPLTRRAAVGTVLYLALVALLSLGIGAAVRDTAGAISTVLALLYILPIVATFMTDPDWARWTLKAAPMTAGLAIQATKRLELLPIAPWPGVGVLAAYAVAAMGLGALALKLRDA